RNRYSGGASVRTQLIHGLLVVMGWGVLSHAQSATYIGTPTDAPLAASSSGQDRAGDQLQPAALPAIVIRLSAKDAEAIALKNNPEISVARLTALASQQIVREARSTLWPQVSANLTAVDARDNSRITAGALNNPIIYTRAAGGVSV